ncbi:MULTISPECIES: hypothetical protein [Mycobacteriaceae]|uniref:Uncharacterized protein n=1 Tax=Mycolicibacterium parafortuitum TaxID=39692 RepID=A0ACC6MM58_MYCPF|nr:MULTISPECIES: hypothetical protein [Mycobacteriaceae]MDZ5088015.1 hypothetical protein [Mycolicibacterium parafortuitum]GFM16250.1 putative uncharacterized protein [Mycobacterium sp. PO1]GFM25878.1 putative uncharacterized protein [Mycobacterium sp. PO2]
MFDRWSVVVGAGVVAAGMSAAMLGGAGLALAAVDGATGGGADAAETQPSTRPDPEDKDGSTEASASSDGADPSDLADAVAEDDFGETDDLDEGEAAPADDGAVDDADTGEADEPPAAVDDEAEDANIPEASDETDGVDDSASGRAAEPEGAAAPERDAEPERDAAETATNEPVGNPTGDPVVSSDSDSDTGSGTAPVPGEAAVPAPSAPSAEAAADRAPVASLRSVPASTQLALTSTTADADDATSHAAPPARQTLLSLLGTIVFNVYGGLIRVFGGPAQLPRDSTVTVRSSTLEIDCGEGYEVPADWYVPAGPTPQRLVYLQHGFLAAGPFYSYTAARLAESTNSIVVTTSLTSNFLACDGCWLGGSPMHRAVADLFADGNTALAESALAAGYSATLLDGVEQVALTGHSLGGGLVAGTAGYMVGNGSADRLAGVVMLDGVGFGSVVPDALDALPDDVPIYNLAGRSYFWNISGAANTALSDARPGEFVGVRLVDGLHSDTMLGGNPLVQFALYLVTGFSREQNIDASEILNAAWLNDMFAGQATAPYYGDPGELLQIDTPRGLATAYVTPGPAERLSLIDHLLTFGATILFGIDFATCADEPAENVSFSGPDTLLSLDGRTKPGQSIGQHVCTG